MQKLNRAASPEAGARGAPAQPSAQAASLGALAGPGHRGRAGTKPDPSGGAPRRPSVPASAPQNRRLRAPSRRPWPSAARPRGLVAARAAAVRVRRDGKRQEPNPAESARAAPGLGAPALPPPPPAPCPLRLPPERLVGGAPPCSAPAGRPSGNCRLLLSLPEQQECRCLFSRSCKLRPTRVCSLPNPLACPSPSSTPKTLPKAAPVTGVSLLPSCAQGYTYVQLGFTKCS